MCLNLFAFSCICRDKGVLYLIGSGSLSVWPQSLSLSRPGQKTIPSCGKCQDWVIWILFWCIINFFFFFFCKSKKPRSIGQIASWWGHTAEMGETEVQLTDPNQTEQGAEPGLLLSQWNTLISDTRVRFSSLLCLVWISELNLGPLLLSWVL